MTTSWSRCVKSYCSLVLDSYSRFISPVVNFLLIHRFTPSCLFSCIIYMVFLLVVHTGLTESASSLSFRPCMLHEYHIISLINTAVFCWENLHPGIHTDVTLTPTTYLIIYRNMPTSKTVVTLQKLLRRVSKNMMKRIYVPKGLGHMASD